MQAKIYLALAGRLVTLIYPRGRSKGETAFSFSFIVYRETFVWGLKIGFRGVSSPGSEVSLPQVRSVFIFTQKVQYSCICLKIPEILIHRYSTDVVKEGGSSCFCLKYYYFGTVQPVQDEGGLIIVEIRFSEDCGRS